MPCFIAGDSRDQKEEGGAAAETEKLEEAMGAIICGHYQRLTRRGADVR